MAEIEYALGSRSVGPVDGECETGALLFPALRAGSLELHSVGGTYRYYQTFENRTVLLGGGGGGIQVTSGAHEQSETQRSVPPGRLRVEWADQGRLVVFGRGAFTPQMEPYTLGFRANDSDVSPAAFKIQTGQYWARAGDALVLQTSGVPGWSRILQLGGGELDIAGNVTLYVEGATLRGEGGFAQSVPPWRDAATKTPSEHAGVWTYRYHHALVELSDAHARLDAGGVRPVCWGLTGHMEGTFTAYASRGFLEAGPQRVDVDEKALTIEGDFRYRERPEADASSSGSRAPVRLRGEGAFRSVGVDFAIVAGDAPDSWPVAEALAVGGLAAGGFAAWKLLTLLFTRLRQERLLESPTRRQLWDAIEARPGITIRELKDASRLGESTVRYQLGVLERHRLVRSFRLQGVERFAPTSHPVEELRRRHLLESDAKLASLLARVGPLGGSARRLLPPLRAEWGVTKAGAWRVVDRAVESQLLRKERRGREVWLWPNA